MGGSSVYEGLVREDAIRAEVRDGVAGVRGVSLRFFLSGPSWVEVRLVAEGGTTDLMSSSARSC